MQQLNPRRRLNRRRLSPPEHLTRSRKIYQSVVNKCSDSRRGIRSQRKKYLRQKEAEVANVQICSCQVLCIKDFNFLHISSRFFCFPPIYKSGPQFSRCCSRQHWPVCIYWFTVCSLTRWRGEKWQRHWGRRNSSAEGTVMSLPDIRAHVSCVLYTLGSSWINSAQHAAPSLSI